MAFDEEDYLDKLLKSAMGQDASSEDEEQVEAVVASDNLIFDQKINKEPDTFPFVEEYAQEAVKEYVQEAVENPDDSTSLAEAVNEKADEPVEDFMEDLLSHLDSFVDEQREENVNTMGIDGSMSIDDFMSAMAMNSERYEDLTTEEDNIGLSDSDEKVEMDNISNEEPESEEVSEDDSLVDEYIKKVLSLDEDFVPETETGEIESTETGETFADFINETEDEQSDEPVEAAMYTKYIDITDEVTFDENDLLAQIDEIISDSAMETESEAAQDTQLQVDDELADLLGMNEESEGESEVAEESGGLSEEDLMRIASIEEEIANADVMPEEMPDGADISQEVDGDDNESGELAELLGLLAENNIDLGGDEPEGDLVAGEHQAEDVNTENGKAVPNKKQPKQGIFAKIFASFKKDKKQKGDLSESDGNENQKVLDELFDENGELLGEKKKVKKKGLFSKTAKKAEPEVEADEGIFGVGGIDGLDMIPELAEPKKPKKEKKKKEKAKKSNDNDGELEVEPKKKAKPKKIKKPKVKKEKPILLPSEMMTVKPKGVIVMFIMVALVSGVAYLLPKMFIYSQAFDSATYYLVDKKYTFAYEAIAGVEPVKDEDIALVEQIETIMMVQKQYNAHERYAKMNMDFEALDALIQGIAKYDEYSAKAVEIGVSQDFESVKELIVNTLWQQYGISEEVARSYVMIADYEQYTYVLESYGGRLDDSDN